MQSVVQRTWWAPGRAGVGVGVCLGPVVGTKLEGGALCLRACRWALPRRERVPADGRGFVLRYPHLSKVPCYVFTTHSALSLMTPSRNLPILPSDQASIELSTCTREGANEI